MICYLSIQIYHDVFTPDQLRQMPLITLYFIRVQHDLMTNWTEIGSYQTENTDNSWIINRIWEGLLKHKEIQEASSLQSSPSPFGTISSTSTLSWMTSVRSFKNSAFANTKSGSSIIQTYKRAWDHKLIFIWF